MAAKKKSGFVHYADMTGAAKVKRTAELLKNPGTRSLVATKDLPKGYDPAFVKRRQMAEKFRAPITEGSSLTYGQVASDSKDASNVAFGPNAVKNSQQLEKDTAAWYDDFQRQLAQHTQNTERYGQEANTASLGLQNAEGMTAATNPSAENQQVFANARAVRQGLNAAYGSQIADNAASSNKYASLRQNVVAPGNKIGAVLGAKKATSDLQAKIGAYQQDYRNKVRESEAQNVVAYNIAQGKTLADQAKTKAKTAADGAKVNQYGYTNDQWSAMTPAERTAAVKAFKVGTALPPKPKDPPKPKPGKGPEWVTNVQWGQASNEVIRARDLAANAKDGKPFNVGGMAKPQRPLDRAGAEAKINKWLSSKGKSLQNPVLLQASLDAAYDGKINAATVKELIANGYKPSLVAAALGVPTAGKVRKVTEAEKRAAVNALKASPFGGAADA